jgi:hypothetical protein
MNQYVLNPNTDDPPRERLSMPVQPADDMSQELFATLSVQEPNTGHPLATGYRPITGRSQYVEGDSPQMVDLWPFASTLYTGYDLSHIIMDVAGNGPNVPLAGTSEPLGGQPSPLTAERSPPEVPMFNGGSRTMDIPGQTPGLLNSLSRVQHLWSGKGASEPALLIHTLWNDIAEHKAGNILSDPIEHAEWPQSPLSDPRPEVDWNIQVTKPCRERLVAFCRDPQIAPATPVVANVLASSEPQPCGLSSHLQTSPDQLDMLIPPAEILDLGLKFYFRYVHSSLPFVHQPTFSASETPCLVLLPMILIGYSILDSHGSSALVSRFRAVCIQYDKAEQ